MLRMTGTIRPSGVSTAIATSTWLNTLAGERFAVEPGVQAGFCGASFAYGAQDAAGDVLFRRQPCRSASSNRVQPITLSRLVAMLWAMARRGPRSRSPPESVALRRGAGDGVICSTSSTLISPPRPVPGARVMSIAESFG